LGRVFNCRRAYVLMDEYMDIIETAQLIVENLAQTTFSIFPVSFHAAQFIVVFFYLIGLGCESGSFSLFSFTLSHFTVELQQPPLYLSSKVKWGAAVAQR
jgi:hypothetical protein